MMRIECPSVRCNNQEYRVIPTLNCDDTWAVSVTWTLPPTKGRRFNPDRRHRRQFSLGCNDGFATQPEAIEAAMSQILEVETMMEKTA